MYINHRHYVLLVFAVIALAVTIFGYAFLREHIYSTSILAANMKQEVNLFNEKQVREHSVSSAYTQSAEARTKIVSSLVKQDDAVTLIERFEKIGDDTDTSIELSAISNDEVVVEKGIPMSHFRAHIEAKGSWSSIMRTLLLIENMPYNVSVGNLRLSLNSDSPSSSADLPVKTSTKPLVAGEGWRLSLDVRVLTTK